jgi:prevent-host-death family protein
MSAATSTIGAFEAKTKFSELLERVRKGEEITITRHEKPIARLVPIQNSSIRDIEEAFLKMDNILRRNMRNSASQEKLTFRQLIEEGRRR